MKYPKLISEIIGNNWAILPESLNGIMKALDDGLTSEDYKLFHKIEESEKKAVIANLGEAVEETRHTRIKGNIGTLFIDGPLVPRSGGISDISGLTSLERLNAEFTQLEENDDIEKILLVFDTPGGTVKGTSEFSQLVKSSEKPVTAYVFGMSASAGYWIASAADKIVSSDIGLSGSIGTIATVYTGKSDDEVTIVSTQSPLKDDDISTREGRESIQKVIDGLADVFIDAVAENREVSREFVIDKFGKGSVMVAKDALDVGMIDEIQTLKSLMQELEASEDDTYSFNMVSAENTNKHDEQKSSMEVKHMKKLEDVIAEFPELKEEIEAIKTSASKSAVDDVKSRIDAASKYLNSSEYGESVKVIALDVIKGEKELAYLEGTVAAFDMQKEKKLADEAAEETEKTKETPAQQQDLSTDGLVRSEDDINAAVTRLKGLV